MKGEPIMLEIFHPDGKTSQIGTWTLPDERNDNFHAQQDIGWYVMHALNNGASKVEFRKGEPSPSAANSGESK
jgi:hypothetical protein